MSGQQIKIEPKVSRLTYFMDMIKNGQVKIPSFQRDYIWTNKQKIELFESIKLEYPIGTILLWKPEQKFKIQHELGPYTIEKISSNGFFYILDGFQRLSTLFGCLTNPENNDFEVNHDKLQDFAMYYDLETEEFNIPRSQPTDITNLPIHTLFDTFGFLDFSDNLRTLFDDKDTANQLIGRGKKLSSILIDYQLPYVEIYGGSIEQAVNIFSRVNSKGSPISPDWMVSALTSDEDKDFNLGEIIEKLLVDLTNYNFNDLKREIILQCIQTSFGKIYFDYKIEDLIKRNDFIEKVQNTIESIRAAVQFLFEELLVLERKLLPYNNQLVYLSYFFNHIKNPTREQKNTLKRWFWITTYSNYFTIYTLSKIRTSFEYFKEFVEGKRENPVFNDKPNIPFTAAEFPIKNISFGSVRSTALVLFLLNYSNNFKSVKAEEVEGFEFQYLFSGGRIPENIVPIIKHVDNQNDIIQGKHKNLSYLLESPLFHETILPKIFLPLNILNAEKDTVLQIRKNFIIETEIKFIDYLGLMNEGKSKNITVSA